MTIKYDENINIITSIEEVPASKIKFRYKIYNSKGELANTGKTALTFIDLNKKKAVRIPTELLDIIKSYFR